MRRMSQGVRWFALLSVLALVVAACSGGGSSDTSGPGTTIPGSESTTTATGGPSGPGTSPGLADCAENPLTCNSGERIDGGEVNMIVTFDWNGWNHNRSASGSVALIQALNGISATFGEFMPDASWEWNSDYLVGEPEILSTDPLSIRYTISDDAVWHDSVTGDTFPVTVDDIIWGWYQNSGLDGCYDHGDGAEEDIRCPMDEGYVEDPDLVIHCQANSEFPLGCDPRSTLTYEDIVSIEATDQVGKTFVVNFRDGYYSPEWYSLFGGTVGAATYPTFVAERLGFDWKNDPEQMAAASTWFEHNFPYWSAGPYYIERGVLPTAVVMVPNPDWWGEVKPTLDVLAKTVNANRADWVVAVRNGDFDGGWDSTVSPDLIAQLEAEEGIHYAIGSGGAVWGHIDFNMDRVPDVELRRALFTVIDVDEVIELVYGELNPPRRNNLFHASADQTRYVDTIGDSGIGSGDVQRARQILADAGYTGMDGGAGALRDPNGNPVGDLVFGFTATADDRRQQVELTQAYAAEIGISIVPFPAPNLGQMLGEGDWDLVVFGWSGAPTFTTSPGQLYSCESGSNFGGMCNEEVDRLAAEIATATDLEQAAEWASEVSRIVIQEEVFTLPLNEAVGVAFFRDTLVNLRDNHFSSFRGFYNQQAWGYVIDR